MIVIFALILTIVVVVVGVVLARVYMIARPGDFPGAQRGGARFFGGTRPQPLGRTAVLFGGRRWAIVGCYLGLALIILTLVVLDGILLFLISVAQG